MAALFLSHAGEDRDTALALKRALEAGGRHRVFLSSDPETGIAPGERWEEALYENLNRADAVVALWSPRAETSKWCFAEITHARALQRPVLPVLWETRVLPTLLVGVQATRLEGDVVAAAAGLERGLVALRAGAAAPAGGARRTRRIVLLGLGLGVAAAGASALLRACEARPAFVTASSVPSATLVLDGRAVGPTPVAAYRVPPGEYELRLEHRGFQSYVRRIQLEEGARIEVDHSLRAVDAADPEALKSVALARGLDLSAVEAVRAGGDPPALLVVFPRGAAREAPTRLLLRGDGSAPQHTLKLERLTDEAAPVPLWETEVARTTGESVLALPPEVSAQLAPGTRWRIRVLSPRGTDLSFALGSVLPTAQRSALEQRLTTLGAGHDADDLLPDLLRADLLLQQGLFAEAHALIERLASALGPRREVARLMLVLLDRAGLTELPAFEEWLTRYEQG